MSLIAENARLTWIRPTTAKRVAPAQAPKPRSPLANAPTDHDLPLLAAEQSPRAITDWERLLEDGTPPALILGAERRLQGKR